MHETNSQKEYSIEKIVTDGDCLIGKIIVTEGRIVTIRDMKNLWFADIAFRNLSIQISGGYEQRKAFQTGDMVRVSGELFRTKTGTLTIHTVNIEMIAQWLTPTPYEQKGVIKRGPLFALSSSAYNRLYWPQLCMELIRAFLHKRDFMEVTTATVLKHYNGGRSFPTACSYLREPIGYFRTTVEERMQALVASGFDRIFQMGNVLRSGKERILFEAYAADINWNDGKLLFLNLLGDTVKELQTRGIGVESEHIRKIINRQWVVIDYFSAVGKLLDLDDITIEKGGDPLLQKALVRGIISTNTTPETLADAIANKIAQNVNAPTIIEYYPYWSSPLYKSFMHNGIRKLLRGRLYLPGDASGAEIGIQENNAEEFHQRLSNQRAAWNIPVDDERILISDLEILLSGGVRPMLGLATKIDRILALWGNECIFDPFNEV
jgi:lysyl-tRNA synthetase class II